MTLIEASKRFQISIEKLTYYEENGLIVCGAFVNDVPDYTEDELHKVGIIHSLLKGGMDVDTLRRYLQRSAEKLKVKMNRSGFSENKGINYWMRFTVNNNL